MTSCFKEESPIYNTAGGGNSYLQFTAVNSVYAMTPTDSLPFDIPFGVKILGGPASSDVNVTLNIGANSTVSSAQVKLSSSTITIKAGTVQGNILLTVDPNAFELSPDTLKLFLSMTGDNLASFGSNSTFNFVYNVCPFDIINFVGGFKCDETGYMVYDVTFSLDPNVPNRILNSNFWDWPGPGATLYYDFSGDANQTITIPDQPFVFGDGTEGSVSGTGTYDACTGTFTCDYDVIYGGTDYPTHHEFYRGGKKSSSRESVTLKKPDFLRK